MLGQTHFSAIKRTSWSLSLGFWVFCTEKLDLTVDMPVRDRELKKQNVMHYFPNRYDMFFICARCKTTAAHVYGYAREIARGSESNTLTTIYVVLFHSVHT